jgi:hypothetical protein
VDDGGGVPRVQFHVRERVVGWGGRERLAIIAIAAAVIDGRIGRLVIIVDHVAVIDGTGAGKVVAGKVAGGEIAFHEIAWGEVASDIQVETKVNASARARAAAQVVIRAAEYEKDSDLK